MDRILERLRQHSSPTPSRWRQEAEARQANLSWLRQSREIAIRLLSIMRRDNMTRRDLSDITGLDESCIVKLLQGKNRVSADTLKRLEKALAIDLTV